MRFLLIEYIFNSVLKPLTNYFSNVIIMSLTKKNLRTFPIIIYIYFYTYLQYSFNFQSTLKVKNKVNEMYPIFLINYSFYGNKVRPSQIKVSYSSDISDGARRRRIFLFSRKLTRDNFSRQCSL